MVRQIKLGAVIRIGFGIIITLMTGIGIISWTTTKKLNEANSWVIHTYQVIGYLKELEKSMVDTETRQRGFLVTNQETFLGSYIQGTENMRILVEEIRNLTSDNPTQQENIYALQQLIDIKVQELESRIQLRRDGKEAELLARFATGEGKRKMDEVRAAITMMIEIEEDLLVIRNAKTADASQLAALTSVGGTGSAIVLGIIILVFIGREVVEPINGVASQIGNSSSEIASTVEQQERTARNQAAIANQTSTTMDQLGFSSRQSAEQAEAAAAGARDALSLAENGIQAVQETLDGMEILQDKVAAIADQILRLSKQTSQIGNISSLVSDLANQTNMLALNAAVEAVRAGEHGKGFTVVSGEIRKLADRSKSSAEKINDLVNDIQHAIDTTVIATDEGTKTVKEGMSVAQETAQAFSGVTNSVNNVVINSQQIYLNVKEQATAIQQILIAMSSLNQEAQETASGISQVKEGIHRLNDAAVQLRRIV